MRTNWLKRIVPRSAVMLTIILASLILPLLSFSPAYAAADHYFVMGQVFFTDGTADCNVDGRVVADTAFTVGGAGNFTIHMASGTSGVVTGTNVQGTPVALAAGLNTITTTGAVADGNFDITIGTAANWNTTASWSLADGGACSAAVPTSADNTFFNANSFTAASQVLTVDVSASCLDMNWTGAANSPTFTKTNDINIYGSLTYIAAMTVGGSGWTYFRPAAAKTCTTNGVSITGTVGVNGAGSVQLLDGLTTTSNLTLYGGTLDTNGQTVTCGSFSDGGNAAAKTVTLGASTVNCTTWNFAAGGLTLTANTATINVTGTGAGALGSANYNGASFNFNGTAHTLSGSPTGINVLTRNGTATTTDSLTLTNGTTLTCTTFAMKGNSAANRLLVKTTVAGTSANVTATNWTGTQNVNIKDITATNAVNLSAVTGGALDYTGNTNITFTTPVFTIAAATNTGTNTPTLNVTITSVVAPTTGYFQYGLTNAYGSTTPSVTLSAGSYGVSITHPDYPKDIFYRFVAVSGLDTYYSSGTSFSPATAAKEFNLDQILQVVPLLVFVLAIMAAGVLSVYGWRKGNIIMVAIGLIFVAVMIIIYPIIIAGVEGILAFIP